MAEEYKMSLATFNIRHGMDDQGKIRLDAVCDAMRNISADIFCLQEVDVYTRRSGKVDQATALASCCQHIAIFSPAIYYDDGLYGIAMLTYEKPRRIIHLRLPQEDHTLEPRVALIVQLVNGMGLATVHLSRSRTEAQLQALFLFHCLPTRVTLVCGDFNLSLAQLEFPEETWMSVFIKVSHVIHAYSPLC